MAPARPRGWSGSKRSSAAEVYNLSEKRRRSRINEKMKALQSLIPNSNKTDKASMLDKAIEYLKQLQLQVQRNDKVASDIGGISSHGMHTDKLTMCDPGLYKLGLNGLANRKKEVDASKLPRYLQGRERACVQASTGSHRLKKPVCDQILRSELITDSITLARPNIWARFLPLRPCPANPIFTRSKNLESIGPFSVSKPIP